MSARRIERLTMTVAVVGIAVLFAVLGYVAHTDDSHTTRPTDRPTVTLTYPQAEHVTLIRPRPVTRPRYPSPITEDDPRWDCRTMGNRQCGTRIEGTWYVVTFDTHGKPLSVRVR